MGQMGKTKSIQENDYKKNHQNRCNSLRWPNLTHLGRQRDLWVKLTHLGRMKVNSLDFFSSQRLKALLMINSLVFTSVFISISSVSLKSIVPFIVARFITGITCGLFSGVATMYLSEIAPRSLRGSCSTLYQLAYAIGVLVSNICGLPQFFGTLEKWPFLYGITLIPALVHVCFLPFCVETPKFMFLNRNKSDEAEVSEY
jgi:MFS family permease